MSVHMAVERSTNSAWPCELGKEPTNKRSGSQRVDISTSPNTILLRDVWPLDEGCLGHF